MTAVIRSVALSGETHKLAMRRRSEALVPADVRLPSSAPDVGRNAADVAADAQLAWKLQAQSELQIARANEEKAGYAAGYVQGMAEAQAAYRDKRQQLEQLLTQLGQAFTAQIEGLEDIAVGVAFEALVKVLGATLVTKEGVRAVASQVLARARDEEKVVLRLSPNDFYLLLQQPGEPALPGPANIELVPDDRIELGGCLVETGSGSLDGRLETQIEGLRRVLLDARSRRRPDAEEG